MTTTDEEDTRTQFDQIVNMTPAELRRWLDTTITRTCAK